MIAIDMKLPPDCLMCPMCYLVQSGKLANKSICNVLNYRGESADHCVVDTRSRKRDEKCPLMEVGSIV